MTNEILPLAAEFKGLRFKWQTLSLYERFEQTIVAALILVIALLRRSPPGRCSCTPCGL